MIEEFDIQIKPFYTTSSVIKFKTPKSNSSGKIHFIVISNNYKSTPFEFTYCPALQSASESICNVGEEMKFKIYGEGFENSNMDIYVKITENVNWFDILTIKFWKWNYQILQNVG